jgi:DNA-binding LacI/PurR family transcriptional regulator
MAAVRELNYSRNAVARALATGRTHCIGIVLNHPDSFRAKDGYHTHVLAGVVDSVVRRSYNLVFHTAKYPDPQTLLEDVRSGATDGVLLIGDLPYPEVARTLAVSSHPSVLVSQHLGETPCFAVDCDNEDGGYIAARHLLETGHRHIAFLLSVAQTWAAERLRGVERAIGERGAAAVRLEVVPYTDTLMRDAEAMALQWLLRARERPDAIICDREDPAPYLVEHLSEYGIRVPDDLSIVNFNSTERCSSARVPLTSVWQPLADIGECATDLLIDIIERKKQIEPGVRRFPVRLDIRASTAPKSVRG